ncbi:MAG: HTH domain-containing protein [Bacteroidales bacterium]|nr:HTH domain-containing protein [Bacteroidales bacterium]
MLKTDVIHVLQKIDRLILSNKAFSPLAFAEELSISERQVYKYLRLMRSLGVPISYCKKTGRYVYKKPGSFVIKFVEEE